MLNVSYSVEAYSSITNPKPDDFFIFQLTILSLIVVIGGLLLSNRLAKKDKENNIIVTSPSKKIKLNEYISSSLNKNPKFVFTSNKCDIQDEKVLRFEDYENIFNYILERISPNYKSLNYFGITGTNGKSTTKEMIAAIIETKFKTLKTQGNFNNHIGLPLTLLMREPDHEVGVLEMGMSAAGEIKRLAEIAKPNIGVITNISAGHLDQLKTVKEVQAAKGELFNSLDDKGTAIVNVDDPLVFELANSLRIKKITYGIEQSADVQASEIQNLGNKGFAFTAKIFNQSIPIKLSQIGYCNIYNALAALATGHSLGISGIDMSKGLEQYLSLIHI